MQNINNVKNKNVVFSSSNLRFNLIFKEDAKFSFTASKSHSPFLNFVKDWFFASNYNQKLKLIVIRCKAMLKYFNIDDQIIFDTLSFVSDL